MNQLVYIASPLSGDVAHNLDFARQACRYAIAQGVTPFAPHLLYPQMLNDNDPAERQLGLEMGNQMLELCDALFCEVNPIPVKAAMNLMGWEAGPLRAPLYDLEPQNAERLRKAMIDFGIPLA